jgi:hypothetical protein
MVWVAVLLVERHQSVDQIGFLAGLWQIASL